MPPFKHFTPHGEWQILKHDTRLYPRNHNHPDPNIFTSSSFVFELNFDTVRCYSATPVDDVMPWFSSTPRQIPVDCFFCLSPAFLDPKPEPSASKQRWAGGSNGDVGPDYGLGGIVPGGEEGTKWNWQCPKCHCWNVRDKVG